ncbi:MAG TPA: O-antigen ligase family protein [Chthonomonadaceae bacterium]|nr:O-antigen ligase family protein [Chthonomonadaceae bacterium]
MTVPVGKSVAKVSAQGAEVPALGRAERPLTSAAGWMLCAAMVFAPFALGSVPPPAITILVCWLLLTMLLWALDCTRERRLPRFAPTLWISGGALLALGWLMAWNAHAAYQPLYGAPVPIRSPFPSLPGSEEQVVSLLAMTRLTALFAALLVVADLGRDPRWRGRFLYTLAFTGAGVALFGLVQQAGWVTFVARRMNRYEGAYFATFNYHANAGAYLNLALAPICVLCVVSLLGGESKQRLVAFSLLGLVVTATLANTSRGAQAITLGLLLVLGSWGCIRMLSRAQEQIRDRRVVFSAALAAAVLALGGVFVLYGRNAEKWRQLPEHLTENSSRWQVWRIALPMGWEGGAFGHGPGTFKMLLPVSPRLSTALYSRWIIQKHTPGTQVSMWSMAHEDYLQTWVEYGWVGALLYGIIFFGGILRGIRRLPKASQSPGRVQDRSWVGIVAALAGVAVHAAFDFPLQVMSLQLTVAVLLGLCWSADATIRDVPEDAGRVT